MTNTGADMRTITLEKGLATFLNALSGKNRSAATIRAYHTDIQQFLSYLHETNVFIQTPADVEKVDVVEYLSALAKRELTGIARARKMSALREYFRFLEGIGVKQNLENLRRNCYAPIRHGSPCVTSETNVMRPQGAKRCAPSKATFPSMRSPL